METLLENNDLQRLQDRIAELETELSDARQDLRLTRAWIKLVCPANTQSAAQRGETGQAAVGVPVHATDATTRFSR